MITQKSYDNKIVIEYRIKGKITIPDQKNSLIGLFLCMKWGKSLKNGVLTQKKGL